MCFGAIFCNILDVSHFSMLLVLNSCMMCIRIVYCILSL